MVTRIIDLGARLREALHDKDMSIADLEREAGVSRQTLHRWINGEVEPRVSQLVKVAGVLGKTLDWMVS